MKKRFFFIIIIKKAFMRDNSEFYFLSSYRQVASNDISVNISDMFVRNMIVVSN